MPKIKNEAYKRLFEEGEIDLMKPEDFREKIENIKYYYAGTKAKQLYLLLNLLYWSGRRPAEIIEVKNKNIDKQGNFVTIFFRTKKHGNPTRLFFPIKKIPEMLQLYEFAKNRFPEMPTFDRWVSRGKSPIHKLKRASYKIFGIPPYFFRHNRFSLLAFNGADILFLKHVKGAKTLASVEAYVRIAGGKETQEKFRKYY